MFIGTENGKFSLLQDKSVESLFEDKSVESL